MLKLLLHGVGFSGPGGVIGPARWPHHDLIVVLEGSVDFSVDAEAVVCVAGDAFLVPPRTSFRGLAGRSGATIWVQHFACGSPRIRKSLGLPATAVRWAGVGQWEWPRTLMRRLSRWQTPNHGTGAEGAASGLLLALLLAEFQAAKPEEKAAITNAGKTVQLVIDWIENHALPLPSLQEIAAFAGWSVSYFRDQFRAVEGFPVGEFLKQRRMGEAARLLVESRMPIKEIAAQAGYADVAAFHRAFHDRYKVTPGHYRDRRVLMV